MQTILGFGRQNVMQSISMTNGYHIWFPNNPIIKKNVQLNIDLYLTNIWNMLPCQMI
jgi:hypothetical protein